MDTRSPEQRRRIMQSVKQKNTGPELFVRRVAHKMGYRFRLHKTDLPGKPDIAFPSRRKAIFVHGCFWHGHNCSKGRLPKSRSDYWAAKIERNRERDVLAEQALAERGWKSLTIWQCETKSRELVESKLMGFLEDEASSQTRQNANRDTVLG